MLLDRREQLLQVVTWPPAAPLAFVAEPAPDLGEPASDERWELLHPPAPDAPPLDG